MTAAAQYINGHQVLMERRTLTRLGDL